MSINEKTKVTIKYKTKPEECKCCGRPFENSEYGQEREFDFNINDFFEWSMIDLTDKEDLQYISAQDIRDDVSQWVYETIAFYAVSSTDILKVEQVEYDKVASIIIELIDKERN